MLLIPLITQVFVNSYSHHGFVLICIPSMEKKVHVIPQNFIADNPFTNIQKSKLQTINLQNVGTT